LTGRDWSAVSSAQRAKRVNRTTISGRSSRDNHSFRGTLNRNRNIHATPNRNHSIHATRNRSPRLLFDRNRQ